MFSITADFNLNDLNDDLDKFIEEAENHLVEKLKASGKQFVNRARELTKAEGGFGNITWNLRGSIGYVIVKDHDIIDTYFPPLLDGAEGTATGKAYAEELALLMDDGDVMLICVAGMEYAYYVEAKGKDVISGSWDHLTTELTSSLNQLNN
jgi:hypothetical protein